ncbi:NAD(P)-dependent dehydrogenase (short-subunit alcohol dehydrogenase family) [Pseudomonas citronellolis]|uniref:hypothetical protein n=1 Tax=Pseudomonas citronellolis TaxID=53408 RepID=UPI0020A09ECA|nr:hypothetical protein [Pseudomonas citronellolis]MCP1644925.1 NAD(P)-dependent dehydrogenase (short-subunit alcohol dehydrogenase family) [Pseudomonas citronellolis]MCP1667870.1 NAD(P)-dependent dehydrogenase (short-subunit alcohol dehydrogenase family) [Pseudomonas citronellolis]MCP1699034.1 NAD(P)-dependent dehydrogenase (short-subunit alcohol dehydrogenase family) [Pseudomonas citronellolis]MCP1704977.1 NAD(P)-dependent dehydrogenase (short-subunit alcohol dehydrogenase family) [Pseudomona
MPLEDLATLAGLARTIEARSLGIHVTLVEPGAFRTEFAGDVNMRPVRRIDAYRPMVEPFETYLETSASKQMGDPAICRASVWPWVWRKNPGSSARCCAACRS